MDLPKKEESCFICLKSGAPSDDKFRRDVSIHGLIHYLRLETLCSQKKGHSHRHRSISTVQVCNDCTKLLVKFQDLFRIWQETEMKLGSCLGEISSRMGTGAGNGNSSAHGIRIRIKEKCRSKARTFQPKAVLEPLRLIQPSEVQIKTESFAVPTPNNFENAVGEQFILPGPENENEIDNEASEFKPEAKAANANICSLPPSHLPFSASQGFGTQEENSGVKTTTINSWDRSKVRMFQCKHCFKSFSYGGGKNQHQILCHRNPAANQRLPSKCRLCKQSFPGKMPLQVHVYLSHGDKLKFSCKYCGQRFMNSSGLRIHTNAVHERKRPYVCKFCGKEFFRSSVLSLHVDVVHLRVKRHGCDLCEKRFSRPCELRIHQRVEHLGDKFTCSEPGCGMQYSVKRSLDIHRLRDHPTVSS